MKRIFKYIAITIGALSFTYVVVTFILSSYLTGSANNTWARMERSSFSCPAGMTVAYDPWSENGTMRYCIPPKEGPWEAWMSGYKHVEGAYRNGKEEGVWRWFDHEGKVTRTIEYKNGVEIRHQ